MKQHWSSLRSRIISLKEYEGGGARWNATEPPFLIAKGTEIPLQLEPKDAITVLETGTKCSGLDVTRQVRFLTTAAIFARNCDKPNTHIYSISATFGNPKSAKLSAVLHCDAPHNRASADWTCADCFVILIGYLVQAVVSANIRHLVFTHSSWY